MPVRIKILHLITGLNTGGAEMMLYQLLARTDRERFEPVVVSLMDRGTLGDRIEALEIPLHVVGMRSVGRSATRLHHLWAIVRRERPEVLQAWMYHANFYGLIVGKLAGVKHVVWGLHNSVLDSKSSKRTTIFVAKACAPLSWGTSAIVSCSKAALSYHIGLGYRKARACVISNGFDLELFQPDPRARNDVRNELGISEDALIIGSIARFDPQKDHHNLLQAAALLLITLKKAAPPIHFLLCGYGIDEKNPQLMSWIQQFDLGSCVHLVGLRQDIPRITAALDIATSSSYGEAFPLVVGEAMACGVPCVVTDVGDSAYLVGETGFVVPPRDPTALAAAWERLIAMGSEGRKVLGNAARQRIQAHFSLPAIVAQYEAIYDSLVAPK